MLVSRRYAIYLDPLCESPVIVLICNFYRHACCPLCGNAVHRGDFIGYASCPPGGSSRVVLGSPLVVQFVGH